MPDDELDDDELQGYEMLGDEGRRRALGLRNPDSAKQILGDDFGELATSS